MTDAFDQFLRTALAPPRRDADTDFAMRVRALCLFDDRLRRRRRAAIRLALVQALSLAVVGAGLSLLGQASVIADFAARSPAMALAGTIAGFALLAVAMAAPSHDASGAA